MSKEFKQALLFILIISLIIIAVGCKEINPVECHETNIVKEYITIFHEGGAVTTEPIYEWRCE